MANMNVRTPRGTTVQQPRSMIIRILCFILGLIFTLAAIGALLAGDFLIAGILGGLAALCLSVAFTKYRTLS